MFLPCTARLPSQAVPDNRPLPATKQIQSSNHRTCAKALTAAVAEQRRTAEALASAARAALGTDQLGDGQGHLPPSTFLKCRLQTLRGLGNLSDFDVFLTRSLPSQYNRLVQGGKRCCGRGDGWRQGRKQAPGFTAEANSRGALTWSSRLQDWQELWDQYRAGEGVSIPGRRCVAR